MACRCGHGEHRGACDWCACDAFAAVGATGIGRMKSPPAGLPAGKRSPARAPGGVQGPGARPPDGRRGSK